MKLRSAICCAMVLGIWAGTVNAFPEIPGLLKDGYKDNADYKPFLVTVDGLKSKCDVCHKPGRKDVKGHGLHEFGKVVHDRFKPKDFKAAIKEKNTDEAMKIFKDAWEKSIKEKNADGKVYFDLIKEGKLPVKYEEPPK